MKALLVAEHREGKLLDSTYELVAFAQKLRAEAAMFLVGSENDLPKFDGTLYLADAQTEGEINPQGHQRLVLDVVAKEKPDLVVLSHSSYGWDLAPRIALALKAAQVSEVVDVADGAYVVPACNSKMRRIVKPNTPVAVVTLQMGAFDLEGEPAGSPKVEKLTGSSADARLEFSQLEFTGYETSETQGVDLTQADVIVSVGRGIGKKENIEQFHALAEALGGQLGASRPVVDAGWMDHHLQVGITGQSVAPKLYIACGISGAIQHLAGMKKSEFIVAVNTDKEAPIGEVADVFVVADLKDFIPALIEKVKSAKG